MVNSISSSPVSAYHASRNDKTGSVKVLYDDPNIRDEEMLYEFNSDGSANSQSLAWGGKTEYKAGTFSDLMLNLPKTEELTSEIAKQMADAYRQMGEKSQS